MVKEEEEQEYSNRGSPLRKSRTARVSYAEPDSEEEEEEEEEVKQKGKRKQSTLSPATTKSNSKKAKSNKKSSSSDNNDDDDDDESDFDEEEDDAPKRKRKAPASSSKAKKASSTPSKRTPSQKTKSKKAASDNDDEDDDDDENDDNDDDGKSDNDDEDENDNQGSGKAGSGNTLAKYEGTEKYRLVHEVLKRRKYCIPDWPPKVSESIPPSGFISCGLPGVYVGVHERLAGKIQDVRQFSKGAPSLKNILLECSTAEICKMLITGLTQQIEDLKQVNGEEKEDDDDEILKELKKQLAATKRQDFAKSDSEFASITN